MRVYAVIIYNFLSVYVSLTPNDFLILYNNLSLGVVSGCINGPCLHGITNPVRPAAFPPLHKRPGLDIVMIGCEDHSLRI